MVDILLYPVSTIRPNMVGPGEKFQVNVLKRQENAILRLVFANAIFHKRAILLIFQTEFTECVLEILSYPPSTIRPTMVGLGENFLQ